mgnify:CR=1 FL=1
MFFDKLHRIRQRRQFRQFGKFRSMPEWNRHGHRQRAQPRDLRIEVAQEHSFQNEFFSGSGDSFTQSTDVVQSQGSRGGNAVTFVAKRS